MKARDEEIWEFEVIDIKTKAASIGGRLIEALYQLRGREREIEAVKTEHREIQEGLTRLLKMLRTDGRGLNNARPALVEEKLEDYLHILPEDRRIPFLKRMLEKEESQKNHATTF